MKKEDFPKETTSGNATDLIEKGQEIQNMIPKWAREKSVKGFLVDVLLDFTLFMFLSYAFFFAFVGLIFIVGVVIILVFNVSIPPSIPSTYYYMHVSVTLALIFSFYLSFHLNKRLRRWYSYKFFHFPRPEFMIFSESALIAKNLIHENKRQAKDFVRSLGVAVKKYLDENKDLRKHLNPETRKLQKSYLLRRMILYSENSELPHIFLNIGLSFIHEDFSRTFSLIRDLGTEMEKFEVRGKTETVMSLIERYAESIKNMVYILLLLIVLTIGLLKGFVPLIFPP